VGYLFDRCVVWLPEIAGDWCDKYPGKVSEEEVRSLVRDFDEKLQVYVRIYLYYNPGRIASSLPAHLASDDVEGQNPTFTHVAQIDRTRS
jgi:hypothetical protein